ncbi:major facilitator superfamily permease [Companilactobacillus paralimentarius DSM 13238 = JCM 10415]|uniref:Major facilitator superfamily permease n=1 Tax=Companilactobacillus paralimentarius DSM 13238 = JCM 10415 TaxID=1122151 RepID=A0A0R1PAF5_9LACO|nr:MDR family MFS transporter [Companilactobacillus paralimentarius]KAE9561051.1 multidrug transporter [Companilactobacillus paralimentarius]KRL29457.1 major facilitator superfamily permease [Companilactobacillus paralimentarius DSM 13238 = JCM 10415]MDR4933189.1 MDR family MFS transporter [Companilactobacillus paralimentarius]QFR69699.1 DHA2 family efflux MFS transporter permease subunit [Companilactobacillus paralimentarius]
MANNDKAIVDAHGKPFNRNLLVLVLLVGTFCTVLNGTILTTAFPTLMKEFSVTTSDVQWLTTGFLMVNGIMIPVTAWLSNNFSTKILYIIAMSTFLVGTIMCFTAPNFGTILAGRLIQAVGVGITMPLMQVVMLSIFPANQRGAAMGLGGLVIGLAPAIGPTLSGFIIDNSSWRQLFGMIIPIVIIVLILAFFFMRPVIKTRRTKLDVLSLFESTLGFGAILYGFSSVGDDGWGSMKVIGSIVVGIIFILLFGYRQLHMDTPFLELRVFTEKKFAIAAALSSVTNMAMVGVEMVLPLYLQIVKGMSAFHSGLTLLPGALMIGVMSPITGNAFDKYGPKDLARMGMFLLTAGTIPFLFLTKSTPVLDIVVLYMIRMFGISMVLMPVTTDGMNALPFNLMSHGTAVNNTVRQVFSSMGTAILVSVLTNVTNNLKPGHAILKATPLEYKDKFFNATLSGYHAAFAVAIVFCLIGFLITFMVKGSAKSKTIDTDQLKKTELAGEE